MIIFQQCHSYQPLRSTVFPFHTHSSGILRWCENQNDFRRQSLLTLNVQESVMHKAINIWFLWCFVFSLSKPKLARIMNKWFESKLKALSSFRWLNKFSWTVAQLPSNVFCVLLLFAVIVWPTRMREKLTYNLLPHSTPHKNILLSVDVCTTLGKNFSTVRIHCG